MPDELNAISVGLSVNLGSLDRDIAAIEKKVGRVAGDHVINFKVGKVDVSTVQAQLKKLTSSALVVPINVTVARGSAAVLRRDLQAQLGAPIAIRVKANLSATEVARIRREIQQALGQVSFNIRPTGGGGAGSGGGGTSAPLTAHERRVNDDVAAKVGRAVKSGPAQPVVGRAAPAGPSPASTATAAAPAAQRAPAARPIVPVAAAPVPAVSEARRRTAARPIAPSPLGAAVARAGDEADFGGLPTGDASPIVRRYDAKGNLIPGPLPRATDRTTRYLRKRAETGAGRRISPDELRRQKQRVDRPETEAEVEYASRPTQAFIAPHAQTEFEQEKRGRGVRGARRSGARERGEPVLTDLDRLSTELQGESNERVNSSAREAEVRAPARRSAAFYGTDKRLRYGIERQQFYRFDPAFGEAFGHLQQNDLAAARASLRGASQRLAGADPRQRKKFFRMFRNVEKVPQELLEKDAALRSLFAEIHSRMDPSFTNIGSASTLSGAGGGGPKGKGGPTPRNTIDKDLLSLNDGTMSRAEFEVRHPHLKREGGGRVQGALAAVKAYAHGALPGALAGTFGADRLRELSGPGFGSFGRQQRGLAQEILSGRSGPRSRYADDLLRQAFDPETGTLGLYRRETGAPLPGRGNQIDPSTPEGVRAALSDPRRRRMLSFSTTAPRLGMSGVPLIKARVPLSKLHAASATTSQDVFGNDFEVLVRNLAMKEIEDILPGRAAGGRVEGPLQRRLRMAREAKDSYLVGEKKPELFIGDSGRMEIVGEKGPEVRVFPESGKITPYVPEWVRRGMAKDLTGLRAAGGPVRGPQGRFLSPDPVKAFLAGQGGVQRVFVVNFPAGGVGGLTSIPAGARAAAGQVRFGSEKEFTDRVGSTIKELLKGTKEVVAKEPKPETARLSIAEQFEAKLAARTGGEGGLLDPNEVRRQNLAISAQLTETTQQLPVRSLAPAAGQALATIAGGRGEALARLREANDLLSQRKTRTTEYIAAREKLGKLETEYEKLATPEAQKAKAEEIEQQRAVTQELSDEVGTLGERAQAAAKHADSLGLKLRVFAANTVGIIGGTLLFGATLGVAQAGIEAISAVVSPVIERLTGFQNVAAKVTGALADQIRQQSGAVRTTVAMATAQAGLASSTADVISPLIEQRSQTEAGNKALQQSIDLLRTYEAVRGQNAGRTGFDQGLTQPTGGLFGTSINAVPATSELVESLLRDVPGNALSSRQLTAQARGIPRPQDDQFSELTSQSQTRIKFLNDQIEKGGEGFKFVAQSSIPALSEALVDSAADAAEAAGDNRVSKLIRSRQIVLLNALGQVETSADGFSKALQALSVGLTTPDPAQLVKQLTERVIPAVTAQIRAQGTLQRNVAIPSQFALNQLANPTPGVRGGPAFEAGLVGEGDTAAAESAGRYKQQVGGAIEDVNTQIEKGHKALLDLVPADLRGEFRGILTDITKTGQQISGIRLGVQQQQVNLAVHEYNNQLRIARRSLQDAKDLQAGIAGATRDTVGGLEGMNIRLGRQLQLLQFSLQQRSITTDLAVAKFQAPGDTPEERFARQEEAVTKARIAQQQLDLSKQIAGNQFRSLTLEGTGEVARQITDLNAQIDLLGEGRQVTLDTAAAQRALDILTTKQELLVQQAGSYLEEGTKVREFLLQTASDFQQQTGKGLEYLIGQLTLVGGVVGEQAKAVYEALTNGRGSQGRGNDPRYENDPDKSGGAGGGFASGVVGDTSGKTSMTVGEAGREKVAVLKNPHLVPVQALAPVNEGPWRGGGGGGAAPTLIVQINNPVVREETDIGRIVEAVERAVSTKLQLLGVRGPSY